MVHRKHQQKTRVCDEMSKNMFVNMMHIKDVKHTYCGGGTLITLQYGGNSGHKERMHQRRNTPSVWLWLSLEFTTMEVHMAANHLCGMGAKLLLCHSMNSDGMSHDWEFTVTRQAAWQSREGRASCGDHTLSPCRPGLAGASSAVCAQSQHTRTRTPRRDFWRTHRRETVLVKSVKIWE